MFEELKNTATIRVMAAVWPMFTRIKRSADEVTYASIKPKGLAELERLKKISISGPDILASALKEYEWKADVVDYIPEPWLVAARKYDDCDGSAWLLDSLILGKIYLIAKLDNGSIKDFNKWHYMFQDSNKNIWSNYRLVKKNSDLMSWVKSYWSKASYLIEISRDFKIVKITKI